MLRKHRVLERRRGPGRDVSAADTNLELWCKGNMSKQSRCRILVRFEGSVKEHCLGLQQTHEGNLSSGHRDLRLVAKTQGGHIYSKMGRGTPYVRAEALQLHFRSSSYIISWLRPGCLVAI